MRLVDANECKRLAAIERENAAKAARREAIAARRSQADLFDPCRGQLELF